MRSRLLILPLFIFFISCQGQPGSGSLSPDDFEKAIAGGKVQLLDVRTAGEFRSGYLDGALQADWNNPSEFRERVQALDKQKPVYVYCASGARSAAAAEWMKKAGFVEVHNLEGGIINWKAKGKPVKGMSQAPQTSPEAFRQKISSGTVLVDVGASWCPPCRKMEPVLESLQKDLPGKFILQKVDASIETNLMKTLNVDKLPTFIVYKDGREVWRKTGLVEAAELRQKLQL